MEACMKTDVKAFFFSWDCIACIDFTSGLFEVLFKD